MGASWRKYQKPFDPELGVVGGDIFTKQLLQELKFSDDDIASLFTAFDDIDSDDSGVIRLDELLTYFHIQRTVLIEKIYNDKESKYPFFLTFEQFAVFTWQFLTLSIENVAGFAFRLMDSKKTGFLTLDTIEYLIELMHGKSIDESLDLSKLVKQFRLINNDKISMTEFESFSSTNRLLCDPFRRIQINFQSKLLGRVEWKKLRLERDAFTDGCQVTDDVADKMLAKYRLERRLNTSLIELNEKTTAMEAKMEEMTKESVDENADLSKRDIKLQTEEDTIDRIVIPADGHIRVPKSKTFRRTPLLIPVSETVMKKKKKKARKFGRRSSMSDDGGSQRRRHSMHSTSAPMLKDINNVEIFKSNSWDRFEENKMECGNDKIGKSPSIYEMKVVKNGAVMPL